jgi:hypothetical protein
MSQALVDYFTKKAAGFFGKPTREGFSVTVQPDGTVWAWFMKRF